MHSKPKCFRSLIGFTSTAFVSVPDNRCLANWSLPKMAVRMKRIRCHLVNRSPSKSMYLSLPLPNRNFASDEWHCCWFPATMKSYSPCYHLCYCWHFSAISSSVRCWISAPIYKFSSLCHLWSPISFPCKTELDLEIGCSCGTSTERNWISFVLTLRLVDIQFKTNERIKLEFQTPPSYQCRTRSTACITRLMSSFARLRVSARTDLDIFMPYLGNTNQMYCAPRCFAV